MWVRGLKLATRATEIESKIVAPYVGAWIETPGFAISYQTGKVAPYVGAWIETGGCTGQLSLCYVAPYVGAWIETVCNVSYHLPNRSRTLCGCVD